MSFQPVSKEVHRYRDEWALENGFEQIILDLENPYPGTPFLLPLLHFLEV